MKSPGYVLIVSFTCLVCYLINRVLFSHCKCVAENVDIKFARTHNNKHTLSASAANSSSLYRDFESGQYFVDSLNAKFSRHKSIIPKYYSEFADAPDWKFESVYCSDLSFRIHHNDVRENKKGMINWVCDQPGEKKVTEVMAFVFRNECPSQGLVVDVGSNTGIYGMMALRYGCQSLFFDVQPTCQRAVNSAIYLNGFSAMGRVLPFGVSTTSSSILVDSSSCDGIFYVPGAGSIDKSNVKEKPSEKVEVHPLREFIHHSQIISMLKIDTEGHENLVLDGSLDFFQKKLIRNAIVEVTPGYGFWKRIGVTHDQVAHTFKTIAEIGYTVVSLDDWSIFTSPDAVFEYFSSPEFLSIGKTEIWEGGQSDVWITLNRKDADQFLQLKK